MSETVISKPLHRILSELTGEEQLDLALHHATKDLIELKLREAQERLKIFAERYGMPFEEFQKAWENDQIDKKYSYEVEKDYWEWEAAQTDIIRLREMLDQLI
jgi:hypothetical protein